jgi:hypothetical protein
VTSVFGNVDVNVIPRIYGASELGVLSITAPGDAHPRVEYVGGEVFLGLESAGATLTRAQAEALTQPFIEVAAHAVASAGPLPAAQDGVVVLHDELEASAVLLAPERAASAEVVGAPLVFVFSRSRVAIVGADDEAGIRRVLDIAEELYAEGGPLVSAHPLLLVEGAWAPFPWRERVPALEMRFERTVRLFSVRAYEAQSVALQRPDVHLADPKIRVLDSGVTTTFAAWPKGTATLLPVVDNVIVADSSGEKAQLSVATLSEFLAAAGDAVVRTGLSPLRYFVPGEPPRSAS